MFTLRPSPRAARPQPARRGLAARRRAPTLAPRAPRAAPSDDDAADDDATAAALRAELARRAAGGAAPPDRVPPPPRWAADGKQRAAADDDDPPQLKASRALANDGLSGFPARAKALILYGLQFSTSPAFWWPAALAVVLFSILYGVSGENFVHGGKPAVSRPAYIDPYELLDDGIREAPYVGFRE